MAIVIPINKNKVSDIIPVTIGSLKFEVNLSAASLLQLSESKITNTSEMSLDEIFEKHFDAILGNGSYVLIKQEVPSLGDRYDLYKELTQQLVNELELIWQSSSDKFISNKKAKKKRKKTKH